MATIKGTQAARLGDQVGLLEAGQQADLILVDLSELNLLPVLAAPVRVSAVGGLPNLVYDVSGHEVVTMMVAGTVLVRAADGGRTEVLVANEAAVRAEAQAQAEEVARRVAADLVHWSMASLEAIKARQL